MNGGYIFLSVFAVVSIVHWGSIFLKKETLRRVTKALLLPPLIAAYITGAGIVRPLVIAALALGWAGDILLLKIGDKTFFRLGIIAFLFGHISYILTFVAIIKTFNLPALFVSAVIAIPLGVCSFRFLKPGREMNIPVFVYMAVILIMSISGLQLFLGQLDPAGAVIFAGSLCFMISDAILAYYTFRMETSRSASGGGFQTPTVIPAFLIMFFYILAQAGIAIGLMAA
jgi:uncharacterized membrane protein YhhN